ncbi:MAG: hypothetical protein QM605_00740 [Sphingobium sp.]
MAGEATGAERAAALGDFARGGRTAAALPPSGERLVRDRNGSAHPGHVVARLLAGLIGGLLAANGLSALASLLIVDRLTAYYGTGILSGIVLTLAFLWAFRARSASRAWGLLLAIAGSSGLLAWLLMRWGMGT